MKKLFLTTALVFPLAFAPALAQQPVVPAPGTDAVQDDSAVTDPAADPATDTGATTDPAADAAPDAAAPDAATPAPDGATGAAPDATPSDAAPDATTPDATPSDAAPDATTPDAAPDATAPAADATAPAPAADPLAAPEAPAQDAGTADEAAVVVDSDKVVQEQSASELRLDWVTGATVTSPDGETIGSVSDLILDRDSGQMAAAVIGVGGFLGIGKKEIAVPWDRLVIDYDANQITSDLSRAEADAAPEYVFRPRESMPAPVDAGAPMTDPVGVPTTAPATPAG